MKDILWNNCKNFQTFINWEAMEALNFKNLINNINLIIVKKFYLKILQMSKLLKINYLCLPKKVLYLYQIYNFYNI